jgi:phosphoglycolate phosphatase-like HAD superfamily hydrolase
MLQSPFKIISLFIMMLATFVSSHACEHKFERLQLSHTPETELVFPKVVFIDWDNTVSHVWPPLLEIMNKTITLHGKSPFTMEEFLAIPYINKPQAEIIEGLFGEKREDVVKDYWQNYHAQHEITPLEIVAFTEDFLAYLKGNGTFIAVISNQEQQILDKNVENSGLQQHFDVVLGSIRGQHDQNKPMIGVIYRALKNHSHLETQIGNENKDWWFIGDGDTDLKTAINANCLPVWVTQYAIKTLAQFHKEECHPKGLEVASIEELLNILKKINKS